MTTVPRTTPKVTDPDTMARRARGEELLDLVRLHKYAEVIRRANLRRHLDACLRCRAGKTCRVRGQLGGAVADAMNMLGQLRAQLEQLDRDQADADRRERQPVAVAGTLELF